MLGVYEKALTRNNYRMEGLDAWDSRVVTRQTAQGFYNQCGVPGSEDFVDEEADPFSSFRQCQHHSILLYACTTQQTTRKIEMA